MKKVFIKCIGLFKNIDYPKIYNKKYTIIKKYDLDLIIATAPEVDQLFAEKKYLYIVHDVSFLSSFLGFNPSISAENYRQIRTQMGVYYSTKIITESTLSKKLLIEHYCLKEELIAILPTPPAGFVWQEDAQNSGDFFQLPEEYIFYPAHFIEFKNHTRIIDALALLQETRGLVIHAVFCGTSKDKNYYSFLNKYIENKNFQDKIHFLGHVPDNLMPFLYKKAFALCMASCIGPTNMPIWEAFALGCPVISSNIGDMPWQVGEAGLLFDPFDTNQLVKCICDLYYDQTLRSELITKGYNQVDIVRPQPWGKSLMKIINESLEGPTKCKD